MTLVKVRVLSVLLKVGSKCVDHPRLSQVPSIGDPDYSLAELRTVSTDERLFTCGAKPKKLSSTSCSMVNYGERKLVDHFRNE